MPRQKIVAGNWKMNLTLDEGLALVQELISASVPPGARVALCPPFLHLSLVETLVREVPGFYLGAQNCHQEEKGAFTGEVSARMLKTAGVDYVVLGHSERREYFGEDDALLAAKVDRALTEGLLPIFCCGEALPVREAGTQDAFVSAQIRAALFHLSADQIAQITIAYEPIWAIGTGRTASPAQAQDMHAVIRALLADHYGPELAGQISILYGGSVNAANAAELFAQADVDGGLVGGASLKAQEFMQIIAAAV